LHLISRFYPAVKAIYVMRNPEKAIISRRLNFFFNKEAEWPIETHVQKWLNSVAAFEAFQESHPGSAYIVRLEDIAKNTKHEMKKICEFLGISFSGKRLKNYKEQAKALVYPWEDWKRSAARNISSSMAAREDNHLSTEDREKLINMAGSVMKKYGYKFV
ncbi:MAG: sulfotransferase, partial [Candidatus Aminicenantes bacterium]|nr:sulfotransferase [Candidatus Aminicenantes bacterium]